MHEPPDVFAAVETLFFTAGERAALLRQLRIDEARFRLTAISTPDDLFLDAVGKTSSGHRYTVDCFYQLAKLAAPGLAKLVLDVAGYYVGKLPATAYSVEDAVAVFNLVIKRRTRPVLAGCSLLVDRPAQTYAAALGPATAYVENALLYDIATSAADGAGTTYAWAELRAARLCARFLSEKEVGAALGRQYRIGYGVESDVGGELSAGFCWCISNASGDAAAVVFPRKSVVRHVGRKFERRLAVAAEAAAAEAVKTARVEALLARLADTSLDLHGDSYAEVRDRLGELVRKLSWLGLSGELRQRVVARLGDADTVKEALDFKGKSVFHKATQLDLLDAFLHEAGESESITARQLERAAGQLLFSRKV